MLFRTLIGAICALAELIFSRPALAVPSFARQTGMACEACHTVFPELTPFGRQFKLNGYTIDNLPQIRAVTSSSEEALLLNWLPPLSFMFQASYTQTRKAIPDLALPGGLSQNGQVLFPQQASLFYAGRIAPNLGGFGQITYNSASGSVGWDNTDIRFAKQATVRDRTLIYGITLNNNPTVQDPWNSTPAWQVPFDQRSSAASRPAAAAQIDGALGGNVAGITAYGYLANPIYAELGVYRSAPQGFANQQTASSGPLNSTASNVIKSVAPYWRVAWEHQWQSNALSIGAYGLSVDLLPGNGVLLTGPIDRFRDTAADLQYQFLGDDHLASLQATFIDERETRDASAGAGLAANSSDTLRTLRIGASYYYQRRYGAALGYLSTAGSTDPLLYAPGPVSGSAAGRPDSRGWTGELDFLPWQNVKLALQYTAYSKFNGASSNYDGFGRDASDNNTLYVLGWIAF